MQSYSYQEKGGGLLAFALSSQLETKILAHSTRRHCRVLSVGHPTYLGSVCTAISVTRWVALFQSWATRNFSSKFRSETWQILHWGSPASSAPGISYLDYIMFEIETPRINFTWGPIRFYFHYQAVAVVVLQHRQTAPTQADAGRAPSPSLA